VGKINSQGRLDQYGQGLERELKALFSAREGFLYSLLRYQLGWTDQQGNPETRPFRASFQSLIASAVCDALTEDFEKSLPLTAGVELLHNFALVHGDVQASRVDAQSRPSIWWVWGPSQAINAGDGFHALARVAAMRMLDVGFSSETVLQATEMLDRTCLSMCEGQYADLGFQDRLLVTTGEYDDMIARKTGSLAGCSAAGGAISAGADSNTVAQFRDAGVKLGMAWQITQDLADFWGAQGDGVTASNVLNKKKSLPLIYTLEHCNLAARREIGAAYSKRVLDPADIARVVDIMDEVGARGYCQQRAESLVAESLKSVGEENVPEQRMGGLRELAAMALRFETPPTAEATTQPGA
jgi:geranylgeranyl diphosphate synthase type I